MPDETEALGLLALMLLTHARLDARTDAIGDLVRLGEQDRRRWDRALINEGHQLVQRCLRRNRPGPYQFQAAINAVHADAATAADTDWAQIVALYDQYRRIDSGPIVALNRAIAVGELDGPAAGLAEIDPLPLDNYVYKHAARAEFLRRLDQHEAAIVAMERALANTENDIERRHLGRVLFDLKRDVNHENERRAATPPPN